MRPRYLYAAINDRHQIVKIGVTTDVYKRRFDLQKKFNIKLRLIGARRVEDYEIEQTIHSFLSTEDKPDMINGIIPREWYFIDSDKIQAILIQYLNCNIPKTIKSEVKCSTCNKYYDNPSAQIIIDLDKFIKQYGYCSKGCITASNIGRLKRKKCIDCLKYFVIGEPNQTLCVRCKDRQIDVKSFECEECGKIFNAATNPTGKCFECYKVLRKRINKPLPIKTGCAICLGSIPIKLQGNQVTCSVKCESIYRKKKEYETKQDTRKKRDKRAWEI